MIKKVLLIFISLVCMSLYCQDLSNSFYKLASGDDKVFESSSLQGKVVLCFYETNETKNKNKLLKKQLITFYYSLSKEDKEKIYFLAVADCTNAKQPFISFWKKALIKQSKEIGFTLYGDWTGDMRKRYNFTYNEANFAIFDKHGIVRLQKIDTIPENEFNTINKEVIQLINE